MIEGGAVTAAKKYTSLNVLGLIWRMIDVSKYTEKDAANDTDVSTSEVARTWHQARNDAEGESGWGVPKNRHGDSGYGEGGGGGCYIATAVYGSPLASEVITLKEFRARVLSRSCCGRLAIRCYYIFSPTLASVVRKNRFLRSFSRWILTPVVWVVKLLT